MNDDEEAEEVEVPVLNMVTPPGAREGGEPACMAALVCEECGAVTTEGHRAGCSAGTARA